MKRKQPFPAQIIRTPSGRDIESLGELRGKLSCTRTEEPAAFERANDIKILQGWCKAG